MRKADRFRRRYDRLKAAGLCLDCKQPTDGKMRCEKCAQRQKEYKHKCLVDDPSLPKPVKKAETLGRIDKMLDLVRKIEGLKRRLHAA